MKRHASTVSFDRHCAARLVHTVLAMIAVASLLPGFLAAQVTEPAIVEAAPPAESPPAESAPPETTTALEPPIEELRKLVGKPAEVTFTIMTVGGRSNLYLNSKKEWRSLDCFTAKLGTAARDELKKLGTDEPFDDLIGRRVRCRGDLVLDRDRVQIVVSDLAKQFEFVDAKAAESTDAASGSPVTATAAPSKDPKEPYISPSIDEIRASVGKELVVTFRAMNAGGRSHLYINSQQNFRRADCFTAQVEPAAVASLSELGLENPRGGLVGKLLEVSGTVKLTENRPNIVVTDVKSQLKIVDEPAPPAAEASQTTAEESTTTEETDPAEPPAAP